MLKYKLVKIQTVEIIHLSKIEYCIKIGVQNLTVQIHIEISQIEVKVKHSDPNFKTILCVKFEI